MRADGSVVIYVFVGDAQLVETLASPYPWQQHFQERCFCHETAGTLDGMVVASIVELWWLNSVVVKA